MDGITSLSGTEGGDPENEESRGWFAKWARVGVNAAALGMSCHACWGAIADRGINSPVSRETCATCYYMVQGTRLQQDPVDMELKPPETLSQYLEALGICWQCVQGERPACAPCAAAIVAKLRSGTSDQEQGDGR
jgi:hypothetical protein